MSDIVIRAENLGKQYRLGRRENYSTLRDTLVDTALAPWRWFAARANGSGKTAEPETIWAVRDLTFEVKRGEVVGIIGRNGAGKSTLLKILAQITEPTTGQIDLAGRIASLLEVGTGFHPELTGRENIFLNGAILGMKRSEIIRKFDEIVAFAEVEQFIDTPVKHYSSGMYMRLAFAVAAHLDPEILVVDEVLAVGDAEFQKKCLGKMGSAAREGRTILFVSHNMAAVRTLCSRVCVLHQGKIVHDGGVERGLTHYAGAGFADRADKWVRPDGARPRPLYFAEACAYIDGSAPAMQLIFRLRLARSGIHLPAYLAIDIIDEVGVTVMQALPPGLLLPDQANLDLLVKIDLPPLIPGRYSASLWVGPHNTDTYDQVQSAVGFEVLVSPVPGRTFPHGRDHGWIVPASRIEYSAADDNG